MKTEKQIIARLAEIKHSLRICRAMRKYKIADENIRDEIDKLLYEVKVLKWILKKDTI